MICDFVILKYVGWCVAIDLRRNAGYMHAALRRLQRTNHSEFRTYHGTDVASVTASRALSDSRVCSIACFCVHTLSLLNAQLNKRWKIMKPNLGI